ncbi:MAG: hypothetical protein ABI622_00030 [Chloroflexota bacterium]
MRRPLTVLVALALAIGLAGLSSPARGAAPAVKVAIIVGPVGAELTPVYIQIAETAAATAESHGATVARAYSPEADADHVIAAVQDANIVVYLGHGVGTPNPYSSQPSPETTNGWGLNGPSRRGDHSDSWKDGTLQYYGEAWIVEHAHPAPGWAMIYSNACYAAGAAEPQMAPATAEEAAARVAAYSRTPLTAMGASAYFATDFFEGAAHLIDRMLADPTATYGDVFAGEAGFDAAALTRQADPDGGAAEVWLHRSSYFEGKIDYWYAFAGDPTASPAAHMLAETAAAAVQSVAVVAPPPGPVTSGVLVERVRPALVTPQAKGRPVPVGVAQ